MPPHEPDVYEKEFNSYAHWKEFCGNALEEDPPNTNKPLGKLVIIVIFLMMTPPEMR